MLSDLMSTVRHKKAPLMNARREWRFGARNLGTSSNTASRSNLTIVYQYIAALNPRKSNPRTHSKKQIEQIARAITQFGFTNPVLIDDANGIVAGQIISRDPGRTLSTELTLKIEERDPPAPVGNFEGHGWILKKLFCTRRDTGHRTTADIIPRNHEVLARGRCALLRCAQRNTQGARLRCRSTGSSL